MNIETLRAMVARDEAVAAKHPRSSTSRESLIARGAWASGLTAEECDAYENLYGWMLPDSGSSAQQRTASVDPAMIPSSDLIYMLRESEQGWRHRKS